MRAITRRLKPVPFYRLTDDTPLPATIWGDEIVRDSTPLPAVQGELPPLSEDFWVGDDTWKRIVATCEAPAWIV